MFYLLNNTPTYRLYEQDVIVHLPPGVAQLHTGDDFFYLRPIKPGMEIDVTAKILPSVQKTGRHGDLTFYADQWDMMDAASGELLARLIRRAAAMDFTHAPELTSAPGKMMIRPETVDVELKSGAVLHTAKHQSIQWMEMMAWLAAVGEFSPTHYDPDFAAKHRYGGGRNIVAGPHMASVLVARAEKALGGSFFIAEYENVQRRPIYPGEALSSFSRICSVSSDGSVRIELFLVDALGAVRGQGKAVAVRYEKDRVE